MDYATNVRLWYDRDNDGGSTQCSRAYENILDSAEPGDQVVLLNKYFKNEDVDDAILDAAERGVAVTAIHRDGWSSDCNQRPSNCNEIFFQNDAVHHKSMMLRRANGRIHALVGSYNLRDRDKRRRRQHTLVEFTVENATDVWNLYYGEMLRLRGIPNSNPQDVVLDTEGGGQMRLTLHPSDVNPVRDLLALLDGCSGNVLAMYYRIANDGIGDPALAEMRRLTSLGCQVRVLADNGASRANARTYGLRARTPNWSGFTEGVLGHKLVSAEWNGIHYMVQSSANLRSSDHSSEHNLSLTLIGPHSGFSDDLRLEIEREHRRYW